MSKYEVLPPSGVIVLQNLFPEAGIGIRDYTIEDLHKASKRDHRYANNNLRTTIGDIIGIERNYGTSDNVTSEHDSIEALRHLANKIDHLRNPYCGRTLSQKARDALNNGFYPSDKRLIDGKQLTYFEDFPDALVLFSRRRRASLESKVAKTLERIRKYRVSRVGWEDSDMQMFYQKLNNLEELDWNLSKWRSTPETPLEIYDTCACDFSANTIVVSSKYKTGNLNLDEAHSRLNLVSGTVSSISENSRVVTHKDNLQSQKRDRSLSLTLQNKKTNATFETRAILFEDYLDATLGDRSHDDYKSQQMRGVISYIKKDSFYRELVIRGVKFAGCRTFEELFSK